MLIHGLWALLVRSIWQERYKCSWFVVFLNYDNIFRNVIGTGEEVGTLWDQYAVDEFYKDDMSWLEDDALIGSDKLQYYGVMCLLLLSFDMSSRVTKIICLFVLLEVFLQKANWILIMFYNTNTCYQWQWKKIGWLVYAWLLVLYATWIFW